MTYKALRKMSSTCLLNIIKTVISACANGIVPRTGMGIQIKD